MSSPAEGRSPVLYGIMCRNVGAGGSWCSGPESIPTTNKANWVEMEASPVHLKFLLPISVFFFLLSVDETRLEV